MPGLPDSSQPRGFSTSQSRQSASRSWPLSGRRSNGSGSKPLGAHTTRSGSTPRSSGTRLTASGESTNSRSQRRAQRADALGPLARVRPVVVLAAVDRAQHQQLGAVQVADHRHVGERARRRLVDGRHVVEVENVRLPARASSSAASTPPPGARSARRPRGRTRCRARPGGPRRRDGRAGRPSAGRPARAPARSPPAPRRARRRTWAHARARPPRRASPRRA